VYLSVRADSTERSGAISAMVSGGRWVRRGAKFEDWPLTTPAERAAEAQVDAAADAEFEGMHQAPRDRNE
jgi:hypothetical protein